VRTASLDLFGLVLDAAELYFRIIRISLLYYHHGF
jgi:hypothetical protein